MKLSDPTHGVGPAPRHGAGGGATCAQIAIANNEQPKMAKMDFRLILRLLIDLPKSPKSAFGSQNYPYDLMSFQNSGHGLRSPLHTNMSGWDVVSSFITP
jgi:hypothetical protein